MKNENSDVLIRQLMQEFGYRDIDEMIETAVNDSLCPGICPVCGFTMEVRRDEDAAWCDDCKEKTVKSCLVLLADAESSAGQDP